MGIKEKLPLLSNSHKIVRLFGYIIYTFIAIIVLGAFLPSPNDDSSSGTTTKAVSSTSADDEIDCDAVKDELNRARAVYWQNGENYLTTRQKELIDHCGAGREKDYKMPTTVKEETTKKPSNSNQPAAETTNAVSNSGISEATTLVSETEEMSTSGEGKSSTTTKTSTTSEAASTPTVTASTPQPTQTSAYTPSTAHTTSATYTKSASSGRKYVGSTESNKYHYPSCRWAKKILPKNEIWFSSSEDARSKGYVPCGTCHPP